MSDPECQIVQVGNAPVVHVGHELRALVARIEEANVVELSGDEQDNEAVVDDEEEKEETSSTITSSTAPSSSATSNTAEEVQAKYQVWRLKWQERLKMRPPSLKTLSLETIKKMTQRDDVNEACIHSLRSNALDNWKWDDFPRTCQEDMNMISMLIAKQKRGTEPYYSSYQLALP